MIKNRREAIKLLGGALGTLGAASLFADENSANSAGSEAQNLNEQQRQTALMELVGDDVAALMDELENRMCR